jgi:hypothetical protein
MKRPLPHRFICHQIQHQTCYNIRWSVWDVELQENQVNIENVFLSGWFSIYVCTVVYISYWTGMLTGTLLNGSSLQKLSSAVSPKERKGKSVECFIATAQLQDIEKRSSHLTLMTPSLRGRHTCDKSRWAIAAENRVGTNGECLVAQQWPT